MQVFQIILMVLGVHAVEAYLLNPQVYIVQVYMQYPLVGTYSTYTKLSAIELSPRTLP